MITLNQLYHYVDRMQLLRLDYVLSDKIIPDTDIGSMVPKAKQNLLDTDLPSVKENEKRQKKLKTPHLLIYRHY